MQQAVLVRVERAVRHCMIKNEVELTVQLARPDIARNGVVLSLIAGESAVGPTHRGLAGQEDLVAARLELAANARGKIVDGGVLNVLDGVDA
jgi:hypothetical protein